MVNKNGVICAIDVNDYDQEVVDLAASMAKQFDVALELLHVTIFPNRHRSSEHADVVSPGTYPEDRQLLQNVTTNIKDVSLCTHHLSGSAAEQILGFADRNVPRVLVLGTHGRTGVARIFGSVAMSVLRRANCPVLILRQKQNETNPNPVASLLPSP